MQRTYTLGEFFNEWGQPLGPNQVGPANGKVTALYNGSVYLGNPARHPAQRARPDPARGRHAAGRPGEDHFPEWAVTGPGQVRRMLASQALTAGVGRPGLISIVAALMLSTAQPSANAARSSAWLTRRGPNVPGWCSLKHSR